MRNDLCQGVSACLVFFAAACASSTRGSAMVDGGGDAGARVDGGSADAAAPDAAALDGAVPLPDAGEPDAAGPDAGGPDAAIPDAGAANPPFTPLVWCTEAPEGVLAGSPGTLAFSYESCCVDEIACTAHADAGAPVLDLTVTADDYSEVCDCDPSVVEAPCNVPALTAGTWTVRINGVYGFELPVVDAVTDGPGKLCFDPADPVEGMLRCETPGQPWGSLAEACHYRQGIDEGLAAVRLVDGCGGCFEHFAGCRVAVDGQHLHVTPLKRYCACDTCGACPEVCSRNERRCALPALAAGDYTLSYEGSDGETMLEILEYQTLSGPIDTTETCATGP